MAPRDNGVATISARQARFVNLDGKVQVKKENSVQWTTADYQITLDKGDLVQTGPEGVARIAFADGTTYTVKGDTLVTVEENIVAQDRASQVAVHISSGQVDLATGTWEVPGSTAQVSFENAVASLRENSRAAVNSDPTDQRAADHGFDRKRGIEARQRARGHRAARASFVPHGRPDHKDGSAGASRAGRAISTLRRSSWPIRSTIRFISPGSRC